MLQNVNLKLGSGPAITTECQQEGDYHSDRP